MTEVPLLRGMPLGPTRQTARYALGGLLAFIALNAFAGGYYGLAGAEDVPRTWLEGTPFKDYFFPSLILLVVVGGSCLAAAVAVLVRSRLHRAAAFGAATVLLSWLAAEVGLLGYVSWMQPATAAAALMVALLAWLLPGGGVHDGGWPRRTMGYAWFAAMIGGWATFYFLMAAAEPTLLGLHDRVTGLPLLVEGLVWLAFFPYVLGLTIWDSGWPEWVRFALVTCCAAGWSLAFYPWHKVAPEKQEKLTPVA